MKERIDRENKPDESMDATNKENTQLTKLEQDLQNITKQKSTADEHAQSGESFSDFLYPTKFWVNFFRINFFGNYFENFSPNP